MPQEYEPSIQDYARFHGLTRNHLADDPLRGLSPLQEFSAQSDDNELPAIEVSNYTIPAERMFIDAGTASLLASIAPTEYTSRFDEDVDLGTRRFRRLKHELPLLRTDHELDMKCFTTQVVPDLEHEFLPPETVVEEEDEGLSWPNTSYKLLDQLWQKSQSEKLEVSNEVLLYLQQALSFHLTDGEHTSFEVEELSWKKRPALNPVSPPLLPLSPVTLSFVPPSDTGRLDLLSDRTSPSGEELQHVERILFDKDAILPIKKDQQPKSGSSETIGDIYSPLIGISDPPSSPPFIKSSLRCLKVEVPLSPPATERLPPWKQRSVSFSDALPELIQDLPYPTSELENTTSDDLDAFFEERIAPIAKRAERTIEQEQLQEADTTQRVAVPVMDFSLPTAPWKAASSRTVSFDKDDAYKNMLTEMKALQFPKPIWPLSSKTEQELKWTPFPAALGRVEIQEGIADDDFDATFVTQPERVDVETLTWKPNGLRIFDELDDSDQEELQEATLPDEKDVESLIRKRKMHLIEDEESAGISRKLSPIVRSSPQPWAEPQTVIAKSAEDQANGEVKSSLGDEFSAMRALESYVYIRKGQLPGLRPKARMNISPTVRISSSMPALQDSTHPLKPSTRKIPEIQSPDIPVLQSPRPFVVSTSFLNNRKLARRIQRLYPQAILIERDFALHWQGSDKRQPSGSNGITNSTMADEADIILSPGTGLIWTTLQKIKQRSLPGQENRSPVRERIAGIAPRYEKLLVMVSEDRHSDDAAFAGKTGLDDSDCEALTEFIAFCSSSQNEKQVVFSTGDEGNLAKWIVAMMDQHGVSDPEMKLLEDETLWEIFLRRAGLNAFAAQAILVELKPPAPSPCGGNSTNFGLRAFINMSMAGRFLRFENSFGGRNLLRRVSKVMDGRW